MKQVISKGEYTPASVRDRISSIAAAESANWKCVYLQRLKMQAEDDFAAGVRMGAEYRDMEQEAIAEHISPDRAVVCARTEIAMWKMLEKPTQDNCCLELPGSYRAEISLAEFPSADVYSQSGECIASYSSLNGWMEHQTIAEREFWQESRDVYLAAWNAAMSASRPAVPRRPHMDVTA